MWKFLNSDRANKSGVLTRAVMNFGSGTEKQTRVRKSVKKPGHKLVTFDCGWELRKDRYDVIT
jgi:hypothetical protein